LRYNVIQEYGHGKAAQINLKVYSLKVDFVVMVAGFTGKTHEKLASMANSEKPQVSFCDGANLLIYQGQKQCDSQRVVQ